MDESTRWREQVIDGITLTLVVLSGVSMPAILLVLDSLAITLTVAAMWTVITASWLLRSRQPLSARALAVMMVGYGAVISGYALAGALAVPTL